MPGFGTRLGWERGRKSCMDNSNDWRSKNVNVIELNCKVVKKVAKALSSKNVCTPASDPISGRSYPPFFNKGGGGRVPTMWSI